MYGAATWTLRFFPIGRDSGPSQNINGTKRMRESRIAKTIALESAGEAPHQTRHQTPPPLRRWIRAYAPASTPDRRQKRTSQSGILPPHRGQKRSGGIFPPIPQSNPTSLAEVDSGLCPSIRPQSKAKTTSQSGILPPSGVKSVAAESFRRSIHLSQRPLHSAVFYSIRSRSISTGRPSQKPCSPPNVPFFDFRSHSHASLRLRDSVRDQYFRRTTALTRRARGNLTSRPA